jgi:hypothetical protein
LSRFILTRIELSVLMGALALNELPGERLGESFRELAADGGSQAARISLASKGYAREEKGVLRVEESLAALLRLAAGPALICRAERERNAFISQRFYVALDGNAAMIEPRGWRYELASIPEQEVIDAVAHFVALAARPMNQAGEFETSVASLAQCRAMIARGLVAQAASYLAGQGPSLESANAFASALAARIGSARVRTVFRPQELRFAGGEYGWVDGGVFGLWLVPSPEVLWGRRGFDGPDTLLTISPTTSSEIMRQIQDAMPWISPTTR